VGEAAIAPPIQVRHSNGKLGTGLIRLRSRPCRQVGADTTAQARQTGGVLRPTDTVTSGRHEFDYATFACRKGISAPWSFTSSVTTLNLVNFVGPKLVEIATSAASRC
jgi:hypothetical protein